MREGRAAEAARRRSSAADRNNAGKQERNMNKRPGNQLFGRLLRLSGGEDSRLSECDSRRSKGRRLATMEQKAGPNGNGALSAVAAAASPAAQRRTQQKFRRDKHMQFKDFLSAAVAAAGGVAAYLFGPWDVLLTALLAAVILDYATASRPQRCRSSCPRRSGFADWFERSRCFSSSDLQRCSTGLCWAQTVRFVQPCACFTLSTKAYPFLRTPRRSDCRCRMR